MGRYAKSVFVISVGLAIVFCVRFVFLQQHPQQNIVSVDSRLTKELRAFLKDADETRVYPSDMHPSYGKTSAPLLTLSRSRSQTLVQTLEIMGEPSQTGPYPTVTTCLCNGTHEFRFYKSGQQIASFYLKETWRLHSNDQLWEGDKALSQSSKNLISSLLKMPLK